MSEPQDDGQSWADLEAQVRRLIARVEGMNLEAGERVENVNIAKARVMTALDDVEVALDEVDGKNRDNEGTEG